MTTLSIKDIPAEWAEALRQRAARNHRSLQGELTAIIEAAVRGSGDPSPGARGGGAPGFAGRQGTGQPLQRPGRKTIEQIAQEHRLRFPEPIRGGPLAVDIIREDRDAR